MCEREQNHVCVCQGRSWPTDVLLELLFTDGQLLDLMALGMALGISEVQEYGSR